MSRTIPSDVVEVLFGADEGDSCRGWTFLGVQVIGRSRWREECFLVFHDEADECWGVFFQSGLTENCDSTYPWQEEDEVSLVRLYPRVVHVTEYVEKEPT